MGTLVAVWVPAFATAHFIGFCLFLYAIEQISGAFTYWTWMLKYQLFIKKKFKGDFKMAWYYTYPGAKEAYDAQMAAEKGYNSSTDPESGKETAKHIYPLPVELSWRDISYRVKVGQPPKPKTLLHSCSGTLKPCEAVALMGPSGAGKSTMLDILAGRKLGKGISGTVAINGKPITPDDASHYTSYVGQEDIFVATITVWEALNFYTELSVTSDVSRQERKERMMTVLETMGLQRKKRSKVGGLLPGGIAVRGISGGEKRRLSISCGLVANPSVLFLDEPTTGLDSHAALSVMNHVINLTKFGLTMVASIHQPRQEIFESFDKVMILSEGYQLFLAPPAYALHWFNNVLKFPYDVELDGTAADWIISTVSIKFRKEKGSAERGLASTDQVREAALKFAQMQEDADKESEDKVHDILESARSNLSVQGLTTTQQYKWIMSSSVNNSLAQANLMQTADKIEGDPKYLDTLEGLPNDSELFSQRRYPRSWWVQYKILFRRAFLSTLRNPAECAMRLLMCTWVSMFAGLVYLKLDNNPLSSAPRLATLFFSTMLFLMNPFSYMSFFLSDRRFFVLDSANGLYAPSAYHAAAVSASAPFVIVNTCAGTLTFYGLCALRYEWQAILISISILSLHALTAQQFAIWCVWFTKTQDAAFTMASTYVSFSLLLCGFYLRIIDVKLSVMKGLTWALFSKYTLQALSHNEMYGRKWDLNTCMTYQTYLNQTSTCPPTTPPTFPLTGGGFPTCLRDVPNSFGPDPGTSDKFTTGENVLTYMGFPLTIPLCAGALLGFWAFFNVMSYLALLRMYRKRA